MEILTEYQGRLIRLTEERLLHILEHPEMKTMEAAIETTLKNPEYVKRSRTDENVILNYHYYPQTILRNKWLCVVVKYLDTMLFYSQLI